MAIENKKRFHNQAFYKKDGDFYIKQNGKPYKLYSDSIIFRKTSSKFTIERYMIYEHDYDYEFHGGNPIYMPREDCMAIYNDYKVYLKMKKDAQLVAEKKKAEEDAQADYRKKHPIVVLKKPSTPAPWARK